ncbi:hypothetical protein PORCRE_628 [Porphyromonas crevioricanis JCM 15906]|uniref:Uncharacterized protein n=1 Tax=Porphyromonas crevioricanis JCM 15906 TaxID=1305617 RepID=T1CGS0_9PORP|nr:hypothetical protein PORCRE_628 [Porphyromonas crevioricanis JCM 15906]
MATKIFRRICPIWKMWRKQTEKGGVVKKLSVGEIDSM